jgi:anti-anti-sigma regulatory factor
MESKIVLANVSADMQIVLDITKVYRVFEIFPSVDEALQACRKGDA